MTPAPHARSDLHTDHGGLSGPYFLAFRPAKPTGCRRHSHHGGPPHGLEDIVLREPRFTQRGMILRARPKTLLRPFNSREYVPEHLLKLWSARTEACSSETTHPSLTKSWTAARIMITPGIFSVDCYKTWSETSIDFHAVRPPRLATKSSYGIRDAPLSSPPRAVRGSRQEQHYKQKFRSEILSTFAPH